VSVDESVLPFHAPLLPPLDQPPEPPLLLHFLSLPELPLLPAQPLLPPLDQLPVWSLVLPPVGSSPL